MSRPKVSAKHLKSEEKKELIKSCLKDYPEGLNPKGIALDTGIPVSTIKSALPKIQEVKKKEGLRGLYVLDEKEGVGLAFDFNFHNATMGCSLINYLGGRIYEEFKYGDVCYIFEIGAESKRASLRIFTDHPINMSSICVYFSFFQLLTEKYTHQKPTIEKTELTSIEINKDYKNLRLDGLNSVTLSSLFSQFKFYKKEDKGVIRLEEKKLLPSELGTLFCLFDKENTGILMKKELEELKIELQKIKECFKQHLDFSRKMFKRMEKKYDQLNSFYRLKDE